MILGTKSLRSDARAALKQILPSCCECRQHCSTLLSYAEQTNQMASIFLLMNSVDGIRDIYVFWNTGQSVCIGALACVDPVCFSVWYVQCCSWSWDFFLINTFEEAVNIAK